MKRWLVRFLVFMVLLVGAGIATLMLYLRSDSFQQYVRQALITEIERASGGRAEMKSFYVTFPGS
jgi:hypothetical protein